MRKQIWNSESFPQRRSVLSTMLLMTTLSLLLVLKDLREANKIYLKPFSGNTLAKTTDHYSKACKEEDIKPSAGKHLSGWYSLYGLNCIAKSLSPWENLTKPALSSWWEGRGWSLRAIHKSLLVFSYHKPYLVLYFLTSSISPLPPSPHPQWTLYRSQKDHASRLSLCGQRVNWASGTSTALLKRGKSRAESSPCFPTLDLWCQVVPFRHHQLLSCHALWCNSLSQTWFPWECIFKVGWLTSSLTYVAWMWHCGILPPPPDYPYHYSFWQPSLIERH